MAKREYDVELKKIEEVGNADCVIAAVAHDEFKKLGLDGVLKLFGEKNSKVLVDVKGMYNIDELKASDLTWWRL